MSEQIDVEEIGAQVAAILTANHGLPFRLEDRGPGFDKRDRMTFCILRREDGAGIGLNLVTYPGPRLEIRGEFPRHEGTSYLYGRYDKAPKIGVAANRPPAAIAGEIVRRLLPDYLPLYAEAAHQKAEAERRLAWARELAADLARIVGGDLRDRTTTRDGEAHIYLRTREDTHASVTVSNYGHASFKISVGPEFARALAAWVADHLTVQD